MTEQSGEYAPYKFPPEEQALRDCANSLLELEIQLYNLRRGRLDDGTILEKHYYFIVSLHQDTVTLRKRVENFIDRLND